jgi:TetR/AcrR family transcriptional regulator, repressor of fatR-cypB operon
MSEIVSSRKDRERMARREAMLQAARAVFAEKGYRRATLDEVAERAEFGKGTLYNYFEGGKEAILMAIFDEIFEAFEKLISVSFPTPGDVPIRMAFHRFFEDCFSFFQQEEDAFFLMVKEAHQIMFGEDQENTRHFVAQRERLVNLLTRPIEAAITTGQLRPVPAAAVAHALLGNIEGVQTHLCLQRLVGCGHARVITNPRQAADFLTTLLFDGLLVASDQLQPTA